MKRCPQCNRAESDDSLAFCRTDGTRLVSDGSFVSEGAGTLRFDSAPVTGETETRILPTGEALSRPTAPTTLLDGERASGNTQELSKPKSRKGLLIAVAAIIGVTVAALAYFYLSRVKTDGAKNSIAVLPFQNASGDPDVEYLSDGISESLINSLSQLQNVRVLARSTMFRFKGKESNPQEVGRQLGVETVLTGRVVQRGDSLTIQADLVNVADGSQLWGERYSRKASDILATQEDIAREIVGRLRPKLSGEQQGRVNKHYTENAEAYQLYLRGRFYWNKRSPEGFRRAIDYFKQAIATDPNYALAFSGLSDAYQLLPIYDDRITRKEMMPQAKEAALKALSLNNDLAEAHASLAPVLSDYDRDWAGAEQHYRRAIELNPNYATAHQWYGEMLFREGRFDEGEAEIRRALELDPFSLIANQVLGMCLIAARRYDEAIVQFQKMLELDPNFADVNYFLFEAYANKKMYREAVAAFTKEMAHDGEPAAEIAAAKEAFARRGWEGFLRHMVDYWQSKPVASPDDIAAFYAQLGDKDKAFEWLEKAYEQHDEGLTLLKVEPRYDPLRSDPRFTDLMRRVGLPQ